MPLCPERLAHGLRFFAGNKYFHSSLSSTGDRSQESHLALHSSSVQKMPHFTGQYTQCGAILLIFSDSSSSVMFRILSALV